MLMMLMHRMLLLLALAATARQQGVPTTCGWCATVWAAS